MNRRRFCTAAATSATVAGLGVASVPGAAAQSTGGLEAWFADVSNYDGVVDARGQSEVRVDVGVTTVAGPYGFGPAAVRVDPGTTVVWEWTGAGGAHDVAAEDGSFESGLVDEAGHTFEHAFDEEGVHRYVCTPHRPFGMKGAVVVGDVEVGGSGDSEGSGGTGGDGTSTATASETEASAGGGGDSGSGGDGGGAGDAPGLLLLGGGVGAVLSPLVFGLFLLLFGDDEDTRSASPGYRADGGGRDNGAR